MQRWLETRNAEFVRSVCGALLLGHSGTQTIMQESFRKEVCESCKHIFATNYYHAAVGFLSACPIFSDRQEVFESCKRIFATDYLAVIKVSSHFEFSHRSIVHSSIRGAHPSTCKPQHP